nr:NfeD family protein [Acidianus sp. RZ1]
MIVLIIILVITGYISDPIVDIPSIALLGFLSYRITYVIIKTRKRSLYEYVGKVGKAIEDIGPSKTGYVIVNGEYWKATSSDTIVAGDEIVVIGMQELKLVVKKK